VREIPEGEQRQLDTGGGGGVRSVIPLSLYIRARNTTPRRIRTLDVPNSTNLSAEISLVGRTPF